MEIILLAVLILLNGLFAMSEIALVMARRARLASRAAEGDRGAAVALALHDEPTRFLSSVQIGITSIGILNGIVGEAVLAAPLATWLQGLGMGAESSKATATALVVVVITYLSIVVGELVPKRVGQFNPEGVARVVARPIHLLALLTHPFVRLLAVSTEALLGLLRLRRGAGPSVTEEEIHALLEEGSQAGVIERHEREMVRNVFRLDERKVTTLMIPRADIVYLDLSLPLAENLKRVQESVHSVFPVCEGGMQEVRGVISAKEILVHTLKGSEPDLAFGLQAAMFLPETLTGMDVLDHFRTTISTMALVVDEYGDIQGLVTLHDVLEALTGEMAPSGHADAWAVQRANGSWLIDGLTPLPEFKDLLGLRSAPDEARGRYSTLGGMLMWVLSRVPHTGDLYELEGWRLEVVDMDGNRVDKVLATPLRRVPPQ